MLPNVDPFTSATKALLESQIAAFNTLGDKTIKGMEKAIALNLAAAKEYAEESNVAAQRLFSSKDPQAFFDLASAQAKSAAEKMTSYSRDMTDIAADIRNEFTKAAETQLTETKSKIAALVNDITKNAPAGAEPMVAMLKSAIDTASAGYEQLSKSTRHAVETAEAQVISATEQFSQTAGKPAHKAMHNINKK